MHLRTKSLCLARTMNLAFISMYIPYNYIHFFKTQYVSVLIYIHSTYFLLQIETVLNELFSSMNLKVYTNIYNKTFYILLWCLDAFDDDSVFL